MNTAVISYSYVNKTRTKIVKCKKYLNIIEKTRIFELNKALNILNFNFLFVRL